MEYKKGKNSNFIVEKANKYDINQEMKVIVTSDVVWISGTSWYDVKRRALPLWGILFEYP